LLVRFPAVAAGKRTCVGGATRKTVLIAIASNATIFVTKLAGGVASGSSALLAEAAHSLARHDEPVLPAVLTAAGGARP
jgi:hypothetical protein